MSSRHLDPIPEAAEAAFFAVLDTARAAAEHDVDDVARGLYEQAEKAHPVPRTGHKLARVTAAAGATAAHAVRLAAIERAPSADVEPWTAALIAATPALTSWDWDERMRAALDLRATFKDLPDAAAADPSIRPVRLVAAWLTHTNDSTLVQASARLAEHALEQALPDSVWAGAWFAVHGWAALELVAASGTIAQGRASAAEAVHRARVRASVVGMHQAKTASTTAIAERAGITKVTALSWTKHLRG